MDFHPVILAAGRGSRMYPLTEDYPKALLPVGNMPLIWYPIKLLENSGFKEALVVVRDSQQHIISEALEGLQTRHGVHLNFILCDIPEQEDWGTADSLRHIRSKVKGDVLLISCDLVTSLNMNTLTLFHHAHHSTVTALFHRPTQIGDDPMRKKMTATVAEKDLVGLTEDSRIVLFSAQADLEESLELSRSMLQEYPHVKVSSQLMDAHLYLMKRWVLDYLAEKKSFGSVKGELIPHLVRHQRQRSTHAASVAMQAIANAYSDEVLEKAYKMSSCANSDQRWQETMRCHAFVLENQLCTRVNTVQSFQEANRLLPHNLALFDLQPQSNITTLSRNKGVSGDCLLSSEGVVLGEKVSIKHSCIGQHCSVGDKTKILNSVIMDHVQIGEGCLLQGCILASHVRIEDRVTMKDCQVGANFTVTKEADLKGETLVVDGGIQF